MSWTSVWSVSCVVHDRLFWDHSGYMGSANERRRYKVMSSLIGWAHSQNDPCSCMWLTGCWLPGVSCANQRLPKLTLNLWHGWVITLIDWLILYLRIPEKHGLSSWSPWSTYTTYRFQLVGHSYTFAWVITIKEGKKIKEWEKRLCESN